MWTALHRRSVVAQILMVLSLVGIALPTFLVGILLILIFSVWLGWLPSFGRGATVSILLQSPVITLSSRTRSDTARAIGPTVSRVCDIGVTPSCE